MAPKTGWFVFVKKGSVIVHVWSDEEEQFLPQGHAAVPQDRCAELQGRCRSMLLDGKLAPYPMQQSMQWASLCHSITQEALESVLPVGGVIRARTQPAQQMRTGTGAAAAAAILPDGPDPSLDDLYLDKVAVRELQQAAAQHDVASAPGGRFFFTPMPGTGYSASSAWKTAYGVDPSGCIIQAAADAGGPALLLAQLQVAFIAFALGESLHAYEAWKNLFAAVPRAEWLITNAYGEGCGGAVVPHGISGGCSTRCPPSGFSSAFIVRAFQIMTEQVTLLPDEFSAEDLTPSSFVRVVDRRLRGTLARHGSKRVLPLAPYKENTGLISPSVERACQLFLSATQQHLKVSVDKSREALSSAAAQSSVAAARLSADEVRSILGNDWDGDDDDDLPVIVDTESGVSIS